MDDEGRLDGKPGVVIEVCQAKEGFVFVGMGEQEKLDASFWMFGFFL